MRVDLPCYQPGSIIRSFHVTIVDVNVLLLHSAMGTFVYIFNFWMYCTSVLAVLATFGSNCAPDASSQASSKSSWSSSATRYCDCISLTTFMNSLLLALLSACANKSCPCRPTMICCRKPWRMALHNAGGYMCAVFGRPYACALGVVVCSCTSCSRLLPRKKNW